MNTPEGAARPPCAKARRPHALLGCPAHALVLTRVQLRDGAHCSRSDAPWPRGAGLLGVAQRSCSDSCSAGLLLCVTQRSCCDADCPPLLRVADTRRGWPRAELDCSPLLWVAETRRGWPCAKSDWAPLLWVAGTRRGWPCAESPSMARAPACEFVALLLPETDSEGATSEAAPPPVTSAMRRAIVEPARVQRDRPRLLCSTRCASPSACSGLSRWLPPALTVLQPLSLSPFQPSVSDDSGACTRLFRMLDTVEALGMARPGSADLFSRALARVALG